MNILKAAGVMFLAFLYLVFPLDLCPDLIPILGQLDDIGVVTWACKTAYKFLNTKTIAA